MTDGDALFAAILAHPEADDPRLQYADWLQENGQDERAEFIRVQCELTANHPAHCTHKALTGERCRWCDLRRRERKLLCGHACDWLGVGVYARPEVERDVSDVFPMVDFARGFVERVRSPTAEWLRRGDDILAREWVPRVVLTTDVEAGEADGWMRLAAGGMLRVTRVPSEDAPPGARAVAKWTLEREWPGIAFELPRMRLDLRGDTPTVTVTTLRRGDVLYDHAGNPIGIAEHVTEMPDPYQR